MPESTSETVEAVPVNPVGFETPKNTGSSRELPILIFKLGKGVFCRNPHQLKKNKDFSESVKALITLSFPFYD